MAALPRLPVPPLVQTCDLYLRTLRPLVTPEEQAENATLVADFVRPGGVGEQLRGMLVQHAAGELNWLEKWWDNSYLDIRDPSPVNVNYGLRLKPVTALGTASSQLHTASLLLAGALDFKMALDREDLAPESTKEGPICMSQYARLFGHARIPGVGRDTLINSCPVPAGLPFPHFATEHTPLRGYSASHVCVVARGSFFKLEVIRRRTGEPYSAQRIYSALSAILAQNAPSGDGGAAKQLGDLTAGDRDAWAVARVGIQKLPGNQVALDAIDTALLVLVLDNSSPSTPQQVSDALLCGESSRWFDKHQLIVFENGVAGANLEHAPGDGTTALRMLTHAQTYASAQADLLATPISLDAPEWSRVPVTLPALGSETGVALSKASSARSDLAHSYNTSVLVTDFGSDVPKKAKVSPDALAQLALQLTYFSLTGRVVATYESNSTRGFLHGRTETVRSTSWEVLQFVQAARANPSDAAGNAMLMRAAIDAHQQYMKVSKNGEGVDRMFTGLRKMSAASGVSHPLLTHPAFARSCNWAMSTSHLGGPATEVFAFGPVVDDGYGIGYMIHPSAMTFNVTAWNRKCTPTSAAQFTQALQASLTYLRTLM